MVQGEDLSTPAWLRQPLEGADVNFRSIFAAGNIWRGDPAKIVGRPFAIVLDGKVISGRASWSD